MAVLFEGDCVGKVVNPEVGADGQGRPRVRWEMEVLDGPHVGKRASYSGKLDPENIKWTRRDMLAVGWKGKDVRTFAADVKAAAAKVPFKAEIARFNRADGSVSEWTSAKLGGAMPLAQLDSNTADKLNGWFSEADTGDDAGNTKAAAEGDDLPF